MEHEYDKLHLSFIFGHCLCAGIKACTQAMEQIEEERFEISLDVHGIRDGPQLGRLRVLNNVNSFYLNVMIYILYRFKFGL